ncbi:MAG: LysM peptidoglycan-binding domain-containing protein, partial [Candidatus Thioglobus sp.]
YLKNLHTLFKGDWLLAIASYNSGPGRVQRAVKRNKARGKKADFWNIDLPEETKGYVPRLLAVAELIKNPHKYNQTITPVANKPKLESVFVYSQLDLSLIAEWTGLSLDEIYTLNPDLNRWATPDTPRYELMLPIEKVAQFKQARRHYPKQKQLSYKHYTVKSGDSLNKLASKFNSSIDYIKSINNIKKSRIKLGQKIIIPIAKKAKDYYSLSESQRKNQRQNSKKYGKKIIHKVAKGESLWVISNRYDVPMDSIIKWNHLSNATKGLQIGEKLLIWQVQKTKASKLKNLSSKGVNIKRTIFYRVRSGDSLSKIAHKFSVRISQLRKWNKLLAGKPLKIGKKLKIIKPIVK